MQCAAHPNVETELACGKCDTPICPKCMVQTPVGARCKNCAQLRRPPMYVVGPGVLARALPGSLVLGAVIGVAWGILTRVFGLLTFGFIGIFLALIVGGPIGYFFADMLDRVTNRKRGPVIQAVAVAGIVCAWLVHALIAGSVQGDIFGFALLIAASAGAVSRLR